MPILRPCLRYVPEIAAILAGGVLCPGFYQDGRRAAAAEPPSKVEKSKDPAEQSAAPADLDEALLKDLDNELLKDAGDLKNRPRKKTSPGERSAKEPLDRSAVDGEDIGTPSAEGDPLLHISEEMRSAGELIPERAQRTHAEVLQQRIIEDLARLIEQAETQRANQQAASSKDKKPQASKRPSIQPTKSRPGGAAGKDSNKPAQDSTDRLGKAEDVRPDPELLRGLMKDTWGHLPERTREQMLQNSPERFVPQYELLIERYYKRLAEERSSR